MKEGKRLNSPHLAGATEAYKQTPSASAVAVGRTTTTTLVAAMLRAMGDHERSSSALPNKGGEKKSGKKDFQRSSVPEEIWKLCVCVCLFGRGRRWGKSEGKGAKK